MNLLKEFNSIMEQHPLSHDFSTDARYTWPDRWQKCFNMLKRAAQAEKKTKQNSK